MKYIKFDSSSPHKISSRHVVLRLTRPHTAILFHTKKPRIPSVLEIPNMNHDLEKKGMPVFLDKTPRSISDSLEEIEIDAWFPSNSAAQKLWRCLECLRDLDDLLIDSANQKNATKRKRKLKTALTPLHSLVKSVDDLCNDIQSNKDTRCLLDESNIQAVSEIQELFSRLLPHDHKADISTIRNKLSAHIDKKMHPSEAQKISSVITSNEFGRWLDIYHWSCKPPSK